LTVPIAIVLAGLLIALAIYLKPAPGTSPASHRDAVAAGKAYGEALCSTYANSLDQAGTGIGTGQSMAQAQEGMQKGWNQARTAEFNKTITPVFNTILPEGSEPSSQAQRDQLATAFHQVAQGVRDACKTGINWLGR
jgi:hypothetical protein